VFNVSHEFNAFNQPRADIRGIVTDSVGVTRLVYQLNGGTAQAVSITPGTSVSFTATVPLPAATNAVEFSAYDAAGNRKVETMEVRYDTVAPTFSVSQLREGGTFSSFLRIDGSASDDAAGISRVTYTVNGGAQALAPGSIRNGTLTFGTDVYGLPLGPNTFVVYAYDRAGNRAEKRATMTRLQ
jgi:hypothetical protein